MARAQAVLGFEHRWLGYEDSGMPEQGEALPLNSFALIPLEHSAEPLVKIIREVRPQVMITYDEAGGYPHPDHIRTHEISIYAMNAQTWQQRTLTLPGSLNSEMRPCGRTRAKCHPTAHFSSGRMTSSGRCGRLKTSNWQPRLFKVTCQNMISLLESSPMRSQNEPNPNAHART